MNKSFNILLGIIILGMLAVVGGVFYTVDETQQVVLTQFGRLIGDPITDAGLYVKAPWQKANYFERRLLEWDGDAAQIPTLDKRFIMVDTTARWLIVDPLKFMQSVRNESSAQSRLDDIIDASTRAVISSHLLVEAIRDSNRILDKDVKERTVEGFEETALDRISFGRESLAKKVLDRSEEAVKDYGIKLVDVKIKRINYIDEVQRKVFERMVSERKRAAERYRSEGQGKKAEIEGLVVKELKEIQSGAYRTAQEIKGVADGEAIKIYANAYNKDPEFYSFIKTLESYRNTIKDGTTFILSTDNDYYRYIDKISGSSDSKSSL